MRVTGTSLPQMRAPLRRMQTRVRGMRIRIDETDGRIPSRGTPFRETGRRFAKGAWRLREIREPEPKKRDL